MTSTRRVARAPRTRLRFRPATLVGLVTTLACAGDVGAQAIPLITVTRAEVSADTIALGDRFELEVTMELAPGAVAFLPDSILGRGFEPFGPVSWTTTAGDQGGTEVTATYPLIAFEVGTVEVPEFEVYAAEAQESSRAGMVRDDSPVGSFGTFVDNVELVPSARLRTVPARQIWVASVLLLDDMEYGISPRPAADVAGDDRSWPFTVLALVFGTVFLAVATVSVRDWSAARNATTPPPDPSPRTRALEALDELLSSDLLQSGRTRDFFARSSEITRRYVESFDAHWGPAWTGTELMRGLGQRTESARLHGLDPGPLREEVAAAEEVKFGGVRPGSGISEQHARNVRDWIASVPEKDA